METPDNGIVSCVFYNTFAPPLAMMVQDTETKLIDHARDLFLRFGIKSVSMDDLAKDLGISKKTLYRYFPSKNDLVQKCIEDHLQCEIQWTDEAKNRAGNAIDDMILIFDHVSQMLRNLNPTVLIDMKKYYPETWQAFERFKKEYIFKRICENIEMGIEEGLYREDLHAEVIAKLYSSGIDKIIDPNLFPVNKYGMLRLYKEFIKYHLHGIVSLEGLKYLETNLKSHFE